MMDLIQPFLDNEAMRHALVACIAISLSGAPIGVFLILRRMTLMGDALSHGVLSGVAIAFIVYGASLWPMMAGGLAAGIIIAGLSGFVARFTPLKEDASLAGIYLVSLALAVLIFTTKGDTEQLEAALFGDAFKISPDSLRWVASISSVTLAALAVIYRGLIIECFDANFMRSVKGGGIWYHQCFLLLVVLNLISAFQAMGMLMALGLITMPAIAAQLWTRNIDRLLPIAVLFALISSISGLLVAYHWHLPTGAMIVLSAGVIYLLSVLFGIRGGIIIRFLPHRHL